MLSVLRSWEFLCERMYDESINPQARRSSVGTRGPAYEPYPGYVPPSKQVKAPPPDKPTKKSTQAKAPPPEAPKKEEVKSEAGDEDGQAPAANNPVAALQESTLSLVLAAYKAGGLRKALRTFANAGKDAAGHSETFALWSKKGGSNSKPEYLAGRLATGKRFLDTFAAQNPWAVQEFEFGLKPSHAAKMGEALELIVTSATKPQVLQHKLRVLSLGHVQMGIKPEMFSTFERALFSFLNEVIPAAVRQVPPALGSSHGALTKSREIPCRPSGGITCSTKRRRKPGSGCGASSTQHSRATWSRRLKFCL